jgi:hypothetical protein
MLMATDEVRIVRMFQKGPFRQFSHSKRSIKFVPHSGKMLSGYLGQFVCEHCQLPCQEVRLDLGRWLCSTCRTRSKKQSFSGGFACLAREQR